MRGPAVAPDMARITHTTLSNGARVSTYIGSEHGPHTLIVAGQHGQERGPISALIGWHPGDVTHGEVTVIRCANPAAADIGFKFRFEPEMLDMNRGWLRDSEGGSWDRDPLNEEIVQAVVGQSSIPTVVFDLHNGAVGEGMDGLHVIVPTCKRPVEDPSSLLAWRARGELDAIDHRLAELSGLEPLDAADGGWSLAFNDHRGGLADMAVEVWQAAAVTVEFASDAPARIPALPPWEQHPEIKGRGGEPRRRRTNAERARGVLDFVEWAILPNRPDRCLEEVPWRRGDGWHSVYRTRELAMRRARGYIYGDQG